jgi:hypothetical protein
MNQFLTTIPTTINTTDVTTNCQTNAAGMCTITSGSGSYNDDSTITLSVSRTCSAAPVDARYTVTGHF